MFFNFPGKDRRVLTIEKKLIQLRLGQSNVKETQPVYHNVIDDIVGCTVFDVGMCNDAVYLCVGMTEKVIVMKYNPELKKFCVRKVNLQMLENAVLTQLSFEFSKLRCFIAEIKYGYEFEDV